MTVIAGTQLNKSDLYRYSVNMDQLASIEEIELKDGRGRGMKVYRVRSQSGLAFDLHAGRALDIGALSYRGINISLLTRNGICTPENIFPANGEFERFFSGGMLWTCGLKNAGPNYTDDAGQFHHLHGRVGTVPPEQTWKKAGFQGNDYVLEAGSVSRDTTIEGHNLSLTRKVITSLSKAEIEICDTVENLDCCQTDYLLLYHFNFGFPFLNEHLRLLFPPAKSDAKPRNMAAGHHLHEWKQITAPIDGAEESVFFHFPVAEADGTARVKLENIMLGIGAEIRYETRYLPFLIQWKCMRSGEYALGVEPSNNLISSMPQERLDGRSVFIAPFEKHTVSITLRFYDL